MDTVDLIKTISPLGLCGRSEDEWVSISENIKSAYSGEKGIKFASHWVKEIRKIKLNDS